MPSITVDFLRLLHDNFRNYPVFVESGTYMGETIIALEPFFKKLHTVEIHEQFWFDAKYKAQSIGAQKIDFYWEDSADFFPKLLPQIKEPAIFFLDGHWSGSTTGLGKDTVPLLEELKSINKDFTERAILIIDDFRLFGTEYWEKITKKEVLSCVLERIESVYHLPSILDDKDRLIIHLTEQK